MDEVILFLFTDWEYYAILQSSIHEIWARRFASTLKNDMRYIAKSCFDTFPFPPLEGGVDALRKAGMHHHQVRSSVCQTMGISRGKLCALVYDPTNLERPVEEMRGAIRQMDEIVASAYGWDDLSFDHGFQKWYGKTRYAPSHKVCADVVSRLHQLNCVQGDVD